MKKAVIVLAVFFIWMNIYTAVTPAANLYASGILWKKPVKAMATAGTKQESTDGVNHFVNFNSILDADLEGDTVNLYAEGGVIKYYTGTGEFSFKEETVDKPGHSCFVHTSRWKEFVPGWFPAGCCYEINSIGENWKTRAATGPDLKPLNKNVPGGYVLVTIMNSAWGCARQELVDVDNKKGYTFACENIRCFAVKNGTALLGTDMGIIKLDLKTNYRVRFTAGPEFRYICGTAEYRNGFYYATDAGLYFLDTGARKMVPVEIFNNYCGKNGLKLLAMKKDDNVIYAAADNVLLIYNAATGDFSAVPTGVPAACNIEIFDKKVFIYGTDYICDEGDCNAVGGSFFYDKSSGQITKATNFPVLSIKRGNEGIQAHTVQESDEFVLAVDSVINTETMKCTISGAKYLIFYNKQTPEVLARQKERLLYYTKYYLDLIKESGAPFEEAVETADKVRLLWRDPVGVSNERYERRKLFEKLLSGFFCYNDVIVKDEPAGEVINYNFPQEQKRKKGVR